MRQHAHDQDIALVFLQTVFVLQAAQLGVVGFELVKPGERLGSLGVGIVDRVLGFAYQHGPAVLGLLHGVGL
jgi:hypothetical protein